MSNIRPWTNGDQVPLNSDRVPVYLDDKRVWLYDSLGNPISSTGTSLDTNITNIVPITMADRDVYLHDEGGLPWTQDANGAMPVNIVGLTPNELNGAMPVNIQDQTSPSVIIPANQVIATSTLAAPMTIDGNTCTVVSSAGMTIGNMIVFTSTVGSRYSWSYITNIVGNIITFAQYSDYAYEAGQEVSACTTDMAINGLLGPGGREIFSLRAAEPAAGINITVDVTRIVFQCRTASGTTLSDFGDIAGGIANGLMCRKVDGTFENIFSVRTNDEIQGIAYDYDPTTVTGAGQDGFSARLTFAGQNKLGVVKRIGPLEDLQFIVHDDISSLQFLQVMLMGHIVV